MGKKMLSESYSKTPLFYTVGLLAQLTGDDNKYARMVLNPSENTEVELDSWWNTFLEAAEGETVHLEAVGKSIDVPKVDNQAKAVLDNEKATEKDVKDAVLAIKEATEQLKKVSNSTQPENPDKDNTDNKGDNKKPVTGDNVNAAVWSIVGITAIFAVAVAVLRKRRRA